MHKFGSFLLAVLFTGSLRAQTTIYQPPYFADPCSVTTYGANGTDELEDTAALQTTAAICAGKQIRVPPGRFIFDEDIPLSANTSWQGAGHGLSILQFKAGLTNMTPPFPKFVRWTVDGGFGPISNVTFRDLGFDMNGNDWDFGGFITIETGTDILIENCRFFDSNAPLLTETAGTGNGVLTSFTYTLNTVGQKQPLSRTITVTDGTQTATDDGEGCFTGNVASCGAVTYDRAAAITVNFAAAPGVGVPVTVTYRSVVQRMYIVLVNSTRAKVVRNILQQGGRIKIGQPGLDTEIVGNYVEDANDNAITAVNVAGQTSRRLLISGNTVRNASTAGIYLGSDSELDTGVVFDQVVVSNNNVFGSMDNSCILVRLGGTAGGGLVIDGNTLRSLGTGKTNNSIAIVAAGDPGLSIGEVVVDGNTIKGSYSSAGIACVRCQKTNITDNLITFTSNGICGVSLTESSHITVASNEMYGPADGVTFASGGTNTFTNVRVTGNNIVMQSGSTGGIQFQSGITVAKIRLSGNYIEGAQFGIRNNSGTAIEVAIINNDLSGSTTAHYTNASGSLAATSEVQGLHFTFATLPAVKNGSTVYCSDCTRTAPTLGAGTGARLRREAGVWNGD
jgi:Pectate lyase superfamily protein